jgi:hypothetical protein
MERLRFHSSVFASVSGVAALLLSGCSEEPPRVSHALLVTCPLSACDGLDVPTSDQPTDTPCAASDETKGVTCAEIDGTCGWQRYFCDDDEFEVCGGVAGVPCDEGEYCAFSEDFCDVADRQGVCRPIPEACTEQYDPVCGCDGFTYGNDCVAASNGMSIAYHGECQPEGQSCGGLTPEPSFCPEGQYCHYTVEDYCGFADAPGTCEPIPEACTLEYAPVCGCDGNTYGSPCAAAAAETSVLHFGTCEDGSGQACGGIAGVVCETPGEYCNFPIDTQCGDGDQQGTCTAMPSQEDCDATEQPDVEVCGCDNVTYPDACDAAAQGVSVRHIGECEGPAL